MKNYRVTNFSELYRMLKEIKTDNENRAQQKTRIVYKEIFKECPKQAKRYSDFRV